MATRALAFASGATAIAENGAGACGNGRSGFQHTKKKLALEKKARKKQKPPTTE
jgi:hypothetical protein